MTRRSTATSWSRRCASTTGARSARRRRSRSPTSTSAPYPHQQRMLDALTIERERHDRHRNLVVAATGTGKTVVAALDYRQLASRGGGDLSLLFVAHREEILRQSLATYRAVLRDGSFGELHARRTRSPTGRTSSRTSSRCTPIGWSRSTRDAFDVVVVDEFHHAKAATLRPAARAPRAAELLGLTATPERMDGQDVTEWFDGRIAVELRLWEAIDQGFLVPFQYFGVADGTDLQSRRLAPRRIRARGAEQRPAPTTTCAFATLLEAIRRIVLDPGRMRALGFCVSKEHARFMARKFTRGRPRERRPDRRRLAATSARALSRPAGAGELRCVFSVEVLGEGVDVPDVDCLLLLRPTASATVFTQQLGRGLRRRRRQEPPDGHRPDRPAPPRVPLRGAPASDRRRAPRARARAGRGRLPVPARRLHDRSRPPEPRDRHRQPQGGGRAARAGRRSSTIFAREPDGTSRSSDFLERRDHRLEDVYRGAKLDAAAPRRRSHDGQRRTTPKLEATRCERVGAADARRRSGAGRVLQRRSQCAREPPARGRARRAQAPSPAHARLGSGLRHRRHESFDAFYARAVARARRPRRARRAARRRSTLRSRTRERAVDAAAGDPADAARAVLARRDRRGARLRRTASSRRSRRAGSSGCRRRNSDVFFIDLHKAERDYSPTTMYRDYADQPRALPLGVAVAPDTRAADRPALHRPRCARHATSCSSSASARRSSSARVRSRSSARRPTSSHRGERPVAFTWRLQSPDAGGALRDRAQRRRRLRPARAHVTRGSPGRPVQVRLTRPG